MLCYKKLDRVEESAVYEGLCSKFYAVPLEIQISRDKLKGYLARLNRGLCIGSFAPFAAEHMAR